MTHATARHGRSRARIGVLIAALVVGLGWGGFELRKRQDRAHAAREAEALLSTPLARAPELTRMPAARALATLEPLAKESDDARLAGLLAWANALDNAQKGRPERAAPQIEEARKALGKRAELEVLAGLVELQLGNLVAARSDARTALGLDPQHARAQLLSIDVALEEGQSELALSLLDALQARMPAHAGLANRRGVALEALSRTDDALAAYKRATELDPSLAQGHVNVGRILRDRGTYREAEAAFGRAVLAADRNSEAWLGRGLCRIAQGDLAGGALDIEKSRELAPAQSAPLIALADLDSARGDHVRAIDRYRAALLLSPKLALGWLKLGNALMRAGKHAEARDAYEHAIEHDAQLAAAHNGLGASRMALGDDDGARSALQAALQLDASDPNPARNLALLAARAAR